MAFLAVFPVVCLLDSLQAICYVLSVTSNKIFLYGYWLAGVSVCFLFIYNDIYIFINIGNGCTIKSFMNPIPIVPVPGWQLYIQSRTVGDCELKQEFQVLDCNGVWNKMNGADLSFTLDYKPISGYYLKVSEAVITLLYRFKKVPYKVFC